MHPQSGGWVGKVLLMALLGLGVIVFAGPLAVVLGFAVVGFLVYSTFQLIAKGGPVTAKAVAEGAIDGGKKLAGGVGWVGRKLTGAVGFILGLGLKLVRGVFGLGALTVRLALGGTLGGLLGIATWSFFSFDPVTLAAGGIFGAIAGMTASVTGGRKKEVVVAYQPAQGRV